MINIYLVVFLAYPLVSSVSCFIVPQPFSHRFQRRQHATQTTVTTDSADALTEWLASEPSLATWSPFIRHAVFDESLRGLQWTGSSLPELNTKICSIPLTKVILSRDTKQWDVDLACQLLTKPEYASYLDFLGPSVAPNAIRHWTTEQTERLGIHAEKLLQLNHQQQKQWRLQYENLNNINNISWSSFSWAMQVVHSRAFRGQSMTSWPMIVASIGAPLLAANVGYIYANVNDSIELLAGLAFVAVAPLVFMNSDTCSVLLPLVDSANHASVASSSSDLSFNPRSRSFELCVGPNCVDPVSQQLFVSYGKKSDTELLLNYGFLEGCHVYQNEDAQRRELANVYVRRNS